MFGQALGRLTPREAYDRAFRLKRASQCSVLHKPLPKELWMKPEEVRTFHDACSVPPVLRSDLVFAQDARYLKPHVVDVSKEDGERKMWDTLIVKRQ